MCVHAVLAHGYNYSVDWWGLGVLTYVLLTGRQPFSSPKTDDPMVVMRRIVDENYVIKYPPFLSQQAKVRAGVVWCVPGVMTAERDRLTSVQMAGTTACLLVRSQLSASALSATCV